MHHPPRMYPAKTGKNVAIFISSELNDILRLVRRLILLGHVMRTDQRFQPDIFDRYQCAKTICVRDGSLKEIITDFLQ